MTSTDDTRILITSGGGPGVWGLLHALRSMPGRPACVVVHDPDAAPTLGTALGDEAVRLPPAADPRYVHDLLDCCRQRRIDVLVPVFDGELLAVARRREAFEHAGTGVLLPPVRIVETCVDKWKLHEALAGTDFLPAFRLASTVEQTVAAIAELGYPQRRLCIRPVDLAGARGLHFLDASADRFALRLLGKPGPICCSAEEFIQTRAAGPAVFRLVIAEYLPGEDLGIDLLADAGRVVELVVRRKGEPLLGGNPMRMTFGERTGEREWVARLTAELQLDGLTNVDARYGEDRRLRLLEINPRPSARIGQSCARVHLLAWAIDLVLRREGADSAGRERSDSGGYYSNEPAERVIRALADVVVGPGGPRLLDPIAHPNRDREGAGSPARAPASPLPDGRGSDQRRSAHRGSEPAAVEQTAYESVVSRCTP